MIHHVLHFLIPYLVALAGMTALLLVGPRLVASDQQLPALDPSRAEAGVANLQERAAATEDLTWLTRAQGGSAELPAQRSALLAAKRELAASGDAASLARLNAVLAGEAFARTARVVERWVDRRDQQTDLLTRTTENGTRAWVYGDVGADLFGHLTIGVRTLAPDRYDEMLETLAAERRLGPRLPDDVAVPGGQPLGLSHAERMFGVAEYAKDGLLPLLERLGPEPWLGRLVELADVILAESIVPTPRGPIPADSAEVNGDMLQVLARLAWATGEPRFQDAADRIALAYLDVLPTTRYLPPHRWDFMENEPLERRRFRLSDHGNEILPGLLEWHLGETLRGDPQAATHREPIRLMLDRLLETGRNDDGLWFRVVEIPSGEVDQEGLTDNFGYLLQAYLTAAIVEEQAADGDPARAARYRAAAQQALEALPRYRFYAWQKGEMDGYADSLESAVYLLDPLGGSAAVEEWLDEQAGVLYGYQGADGSVQDGYLDGNFIRTALLYGLRQTQGLRLEPWREDTLVGAAPDGGCLAVWVSSGANWTGQLVLDIPRHAQFLNLPVDYPRLNTWPEWFVAEPGRTYQVVEMGTGTVSQQSGALLAAGLPIRLQAKAPQALQICPLEP